MANIIEWSETLESLFNKATNPENIADDWDSIIQFCDEVNKSFEGPQHALRLLVHKITSPQEKESLLALVVLEACVKNCGKRFHAEIGKFRFLNELIKVISPKYLGNHRSDKVKKKCIELMYSWTIGLRHEMKVVEAYSMLKKQGIVKEDPSYLDKTFDIPDIPPRPKNTIFDDQEKSKLLARLLKSKNPEDLQAANRLIKNMVKQESERQEKASRRVTELETINNNIKLLSEMLQEYNPSTTQSESDVMKELYDTLDKHRPKLFRLAADAEEKDEAIAEILVTNDEVMKVMVQYKKVVGLEQNNTSKTRADSVALLDFELGGDVTESTSPKPPSILDDDLAALGLNDINDVSMISATSSVPPNTSSCSGGPVITNSNTMEELGAIFGSAPKSTVNTISSFPSSSVITHSSVFPISATGAGQQSLFSSTPAPPVNNSMSVFDDLLSQPMIQHNLPAEKSTFPVTTAQGTKIPLNQLLASSSPKPQMNNTDLPPAYTTLADTSRTFASNIASPAPQPATAELLDMSDVFVSFESIKPGTVAPLTAYDKNGLKLVIHFAKDSPKPHIIVMVVAIVSTNTGSIQNLAFQAAVPKLMRVKLQAPSATDLPPYNPILPPTAITQVMLLSNPQKVLSPPEAREKIRVKFKLTYELDNKKISDVGEVENFPVQ